MKRILIIQTAFIGDVILATPVVEKLHEYFPDAELDFLLRKGNESLLAGHPWVHEVLVWDKGADKRKHLFGMMGRIRRNKYDMVVNLHRHFSSGLMTVFSGAEKRIGFDKNPLSFLFNTRVQHVIGTKENPKHEVERNIDLIASLTDNRLTKPKLYPSEKDFQETKKYKGEGYVCIAPTSVWFTKQFPRHKWVELIKLLPAETKIYLLGAASDTVYCDGLIDASERKNIENLCGKLTLLQSAALMKDAKMNYVNDSAPMHLASAMNAPVTAIYCSTIPEFGFGPLSDNSKIIETLIELDCHPCGLHGFSACPKGHFKCGESIEVIRLL